MFSESQKLIAHTTPCNIRFYFGKEKMDIIIKFNLNIKLRNPQTDEETNKKVSAMNYYSYRMMIRENAENHILKCRQLFHQYIVDMYDGKCTKQYPRDLLPETITGNDGYPLYRRRSIEDGSKSITLKVTMMLK